MFSRMNFFKAVRENEKVFRKTLRDIHDNRNRRPMGVFVPEDFDTESDLATLFEKHVTGNRVGCFTITNFTVSKSDVTITFLCASILVGVGASLSYKIQGDDIKYVKLLSMERS